MLLLPSWTLRTPALEAYYCPHVVVEETEAQRSRETFPRSQLVSAEPRVNPDFSDAEAEAVHH